MNNETRRLLVEFSFTSDWLEEFSVTITWRGKQNQCKPEKVSTLS